MKPLTFPKSHILRGCRAFPPIFDHGLKQSKGPLLAVMLPNNLPHSRLGLSVPKRVASKAVTRNRLKRLLRESFRLMQHDLPVGYDIVLVVRHYDPGAILADYQRMLSSLLIALHAKWQSRK